MNGDVKARILSAINTVAKLDDYTPADCIYSQKYGISSVGWVYIFMQLAKDYNFAINDDFVDALEAATFARLEAVLARVENTGAPDAA